MAVSGGVNPVYRAGDIVSFAVSAAVTAGALVEVSGQKTVAIPAAASKKIVGVALQAGSAVGDVIGVKILGDIFNLKAEGAVSAGDLVSSAADATGDVSTVTVDTTATVNETTVEAALTQVLSIVGVALQDIADEASGWVLVKG